MMMRAQTNIHIAINRRVRERPGSLILAEQPSKRSSGALLHLEFYAAEPFQQIEGRAVDLNRVDRGAALLPARHAWVSATRRCRWAAVLAILSRS